MDFREKVIELIKPHMHGIDISSTLEVPPNPELGDFALPCFQLAKLFKKSPIAIAEELAQKIEPKGIILKVQNVGPYVNFFLNRSSASKDVLLSIHSFKHKYGNSKEGKNKKVIIEYSSPNIAKPFGIAHMRSTMIGNALKNIYVSKGYKVISINHPGDWGTQFGKLIVAYKKWSNKRQLKSNPIKHLTEIYVQFHEEAEKDPKLEDEARAWFARLEAGDRQAIALWRQFRSLSMKEFERTYKKLGIKFDSSVGESFYINQLGSVVKLLSSKGLLEESEGAMVVKLDNMPPCIIKKSNDSSIYATRDLAAAIYRKKKYNFNRMLYVVDSRQSLHFAQFFKVLELAGFEWSRDLEHVPFGMMTLEGEAMATRKGTFIEMEEVLKRAEQLVKDIIKEKNPKLKNRDKVALQVAIGAIVFWDLSHDRIRDIDFEWSKVLDFEGETGPYVQYTYARCCSILRKAKIKPNPKVDFSLLDKPEEHNLITRLAELNDVISESLNNNKPSTLAKYCISLSQSFNEFYQHHTVISDDKKLMQSRLLLVSCVSLVLEKCLSMLGISAPKEM